MLSRHACPLPEALLMQVYECEYHPATAAPVSISHLYGVHGGALLQKHTQPDHVRQRVIIDAEKV
jgi:hypothetical protein